MGASFDCSATLPGLSDLSTHADKAFVTGVGVRSGIQVTDGDEWHAETGGVGITKTVDATGAHTLGDTVRYSIAADIPGAAPLTAYVIRDVSTTDKGQVGVQYDTITVALSAGQPLVAGTDYVLNRPTFDAAGNVTNPAAAVCAGIQTGLVRYGYFNIQFTAAGLAALASAKAADPAAQVLVKYAATLITGDSGQPGAPDTFTNEAQLYPNQLAIDRCQPRTSDAEFMVGVTSVDKFAGDVLARLTAASGTAVDMSGALLSGAVFRVYASQADALAKANPVAMLKSTDTGSVPVDPASDGYSLVEGVVNCAYQLTPRANTGVYFTGELVYGTYWVVEETAPAGYAVAADPMPFTVDQTTSWGVNGPASPSCDPNRDAVPEADPNTTITVTPVYNTVTQQWDTTADWPVQRVVDPRATDNSLVDVVVNALAATGAPQWLAATLVAAVVLVAGGAMIVWLSRRRAARSAR
jgi:hypothetical protein